MQNLKIPALLSSLLISITAVSLISAETYSGSNRCSMDIDAGKRFYIRSDGDFIIESSSEIYYARPVLAEYSNFRTDERVLKKRIEYRIEKTGGREIDLRKYLKKGYAGTHVFLTGIKNVKTVSSEFLFSEYSGKAVQVIVRLDDTYTGYLSELFNTPFIWVPGRVRGIHQTDAGIGSDCISFVVYGMRRMGHNIPYINPYRIYEYTEKISDGPCREKGGIYFDSSGRMVSLKKIMKGDLIYFKAHVAVFYEDRGIRGFLDKDDLVIHSIKTGAHISPIEKSEYYNLPVEVLRWSGISKGYSADYNRTVADIISEKQE